METVTTMLVLLVVLALLAGAAVAFQAAFNGRVSVATGRPTVAALVQLHRGFGAYCW